MSLVDKELTQNMHICITVTQYIDTLNRVKLEA
jgi:hypothetical protein